MLRRTGAWMLTVYIKDTAAVATGAMRVAMEWESVAGCDANCVLLYFWAMLIWGCAPWAVLICGLAHLGLCSMG
jgi:hypothetical protein